MGGGSAGGQAKTYYASLSVTNQSPDDIEIKYTVNGQEQKQEFPKGSARYINVGEGGLKITPTEAKNTVSVTVGGGSAGSLSVTNQSPDDIEIKYTVNGQEQKQEFPKGSAGGFDVTVQSAAEPGAIEFKAYKKGTSTSVLMNGRPILSVSLVDVKKSISVVISDSSGMLIEVV